VITGPKPDFIIVGAMKCATSTLHEQIAQQPGFFMSIPKEPNYFSDDNIYDRGPEWYSSLFLGAEPSDIRGESSTHYTKLPTYPETLSRMRSALPDLKLIYVIRNPIDRLVSQYIHERTERTIDGPIDQALETFPRLIDYSRYDMQIAPFVDAYGPEKILISSAERLSERPQEELERICRFLGYQGQPRWADTMARMNVSKERLIKSPLRDFLVNQPILQAIRRRFIPKSWRDGIKSFWQIPDRPHLSEESVNRLKEIFDADLEQLGQRLGIRLSCDHFRDQILAMPEGATEVRVTDGVVS
jgi:hypothetical protein